MEVSTVVVDADTAGAAMRVCLVDWLGSLKK